MSKENGKSSSWEASRQEMARICGVSPSEITEDDVFTFRYGSNSEPTPKLHLRKNSKKPVADGQFDDDPGIQNAIKHLEG